MIGTNDPPVIGVPVLPLLQLVHEEEVLLGPGSVVAGVHHSLIIMSVPAKQEIQSLSTKSDQNNFY